MRHLSLLQGAPIGIYKLSSGAYFEPLYFTAVAGDTEVILTWEDMQIWDHLV